MSLPGDEESYDFDSEVEGSDDEGSEDFDEGETGEPDEIEENRRGVESTPETYTPPPRRRVVEVSQRPARNGKAKIRVRPMPSRLASEWPDVQTMLITNRNGSQILFVKP